MHINNTKLVFKKYIVVIALLCLSNNIFGQIEFEDAYFIDNLDTKVACLIKNIDWKNNPTAFEYKLQEDSEIKTGSIKYVKEFGFSNTTKYVRANVDIDRSKLDIHGISKNKRANFANETLFLKVLTEGKATLYKYEEKSIIRFFFNVNNSKIEQLIYKKYYFTNDRGYVENKILENFTFRNQIWLALQCSTISKTQLENLNYRKANLKAIFSKYNTCSNSQNIDFDKKTKKGLYHITLRAGLNNSSFRLQRFDLGREIDFGYQSSLRLGVELEAVFPFNRNKWALIFEPSYHSYNNELEETENSNDTGFIDYSSLDFNLGIRHYLFINNTSKLFINAGYFYSAVFNSKTFFSFDFERELKPNGSAFLGFGFNYNNRLSLEVRYHVDRNILTTTGSGLDSNYQTFGFIFGYTIF